MSNQNEDHTCLFCAKFSGSEQSIALRQWYDDPIIEDKDFVAVPSLGQLVPGYILIIPRRHVSSMAQLSMEELAKLRKFCGQVTVFQKKCWGMPLIFEHGMCSEEHRAGACIDHAHWHLVPTSEELVPHDIRLTRIDSFEAFAASTGQANSYLYVGNCTGRGYILDDRNIPGQFFRRRLALAVQRPDEWDYSVFPLYENIRTTYECAKTILQNGPHW